MPLMKEKSFTIADIYKLPEGQRCELIDGVLYDMAPPGRTHQKFVSQITYLLNRYILEHQGSCEVYPAPFAVFIRQDEANYVEPDISVVCDLQKLNDRGCQGAPDLVMEIVSPSSRKMDYTIKTALYAQSDVREYWIIDTEKRRSTVYYYEEDAAPVIIPFERPVISSIFREFSVTMDSLL